MWRRTVADYSPLMACRFTNSCWITCVMPLKFSSTKACSASSVIFGISKFNQRRVSSSSLLIQLMMLRARCGDMVCRSSIHNLESASSFDPLFAHHLAASSAAALSSTSNSKTVASSSAAAGQQSRTAPSHFDDVFGS